MTSEPGAEPAGSTAVQEAGGSRRRNLRRTISGVVAIVAAVVAGWVWFGRMSVPLPAGVTQQDYERVAQRLQRTSSQSVDRDAVFFRLGIEQTTHQKWQTAAALFASIDPLRSHHGREARYLQAQSVLQLDRLRESERLFREYLADAPIVGKQPWLTQPSREDRLQALHYLSYLLAVELRFEERQTLLAGLVKSGNADLFDTLACHFQSLMEWNNTHGVERLENACRVSPEDWQLQAILGQYRIAQGRSEVARELLTVCRDKLPSDLTIAADYLTCLHELGDDEAYLEMATGLPPMVDGEPLELLRHRGEVMLLQNRPADAEVYLLQAITRDPANVACRLGYAKALLALNRIERRTQELATIQNLVRIQNRLGWATSKSPPPEILLEICHLSRDAGLREAAADLCRVAMRLVDDRAPFEQLLRELASPQQEGGSP